MASEKEKVQQSLGFIPVDALFSELDRLRCDPYFLSSFASRSLLDAITFWAMEATVLTIDSQ